MTRQHSQALPEQQLVSCEICLKSIPVSEARHAETDDYVAYFCGLDCYDLWIKQQALEEEGKQAQK